MIELTGKYNTAKVFTDKLDNSTISQIINLLNQDFTVGAKIRVMPDVHAGAGCVVGFTAELGEKVVSNLVGVDIGCGMLVVELGKADIDLSVFDEAVHKRVPAGHEIHSRSSVYKRHNLDEIMGRVENDLRCYGALRGVERFESALGTLGGGNHFIELNEDEEGYKYLVIHSGSRNLGKQVAEYYQGVAVGSLSGKDKIPQAREAKINALKSQGRARDIPQALRELDRQAQNVYPSYPEDLCFLTGIGRENYLNDMEICQGYAAVNRETMADLILQGLGAFNFWHTVHNYIDFSDNIIRKGAVSAYAGERLIIPMNMRDGSIIAVGKGNADWNNSAPHGAGRLMSRSQAKRELSVSEFESQMSAVYSTTVGPDTLDEAPMAYKPMQEIIDNIGDTVSVERIIKPIYNFKAGMEYDRFHRK